MKGWTLKIIVSVAIFVIGCLTAPLVALLWPFGLAAFAWNECDCVRRDGGGEEDL